MITSIINNRVATLGPSPILFISEMKEKEKNTHLLIVYSDQSAVWLETFFRVRLYTWKSMYVCLLNCT